MTESKLPSEISLEWDGLIDFSIGGQKSKIDPISISDEIFMQLTDSQLLEGDEDNHTVKTDLKSQHRFCEIIQEVILKETSVRVSKIVAKEAYVKIQEITDEVISFFEHTPNSESTSVSE